MGAGGPGDVAVVREGPFLVIAIDATPLALGAPRGVARALRTLLEGWSREPPPVPVKLFAPRDLPPDVPRLGGVVLPRRPVGSARRFRRRLGRLLECHGASVLYVPFSAFPRTSIPVVAMVHELPFVRVGAIEGRARAWRHRRWLRKNARTCAAIVVPSRTVRKDVLALHPEAADRVHVVQGAFDPGPWEQAGREAAPSSEPVVVAVGTGPRGWGPRKKGLDVLFRALPRVGVAGLRLVVVGDGLGRVPGGVEVRRGIGDQDLRRLVASARILVHPARSEGFGYPPLEAMAAGVPVVASDGGALPEVLGDAALLVPAGDGAALAAALRRVLLEEDVRQRLVAAGRVRARAYDPLVASRRLGAVLSRVGGGR